LLHVLMRVFFSGCDGISPLHSCRCRCYCCAPTVTACDLDAAPPPDNVVRVAGSEAHAGPGDVSAGFSCNTAGNYNGTVVATCAISGGVATVTFDNSLTQCNLGEAV
jgi:hypothetical protein